MKLPAHLMQLFDSFIESSDQMLGARLVLAASYPKSKLGIVKNASLLHCLSCNYETPYIRCLSSTLSISIYMGWDATNETDIKIRP